MELDYYLKLYKLANNKEPSDDVIAYFKSGVEIPRIPPNVKESKIDESPNINTIIEKEDLQNSYDE